MTDDIQQALEKASWKFTKTMPYNPHHYTLKHTWSDKKLFKKIVYTINKLGKKEMYKNKIYNILYLGEYKYWTMVPDENQVILINRKPKDVD